MRRPLLLSAALAAAVLVAYLPALRASFVWNDDTYLTSNPTLDGASGLATIWTDTRANEQYYPLVFTSFWVEKRLWGLAPFGYHLVNVLLHLGSALLLWRLLARLGVAGGWFAAGVFALHPLCVESVAWVTERKNTLSLLLSLAAALAFFAAADAREAAAERRSRRRAAAEPPWYRRAAALYAAALACFVLALFAKTTASLLAPALLVIVWWRSGRLRWADARAAAPFLAIGAALAWQTAWLERTMVQASGPEWSLGLPGRIVLAGRTTLFYAAKMLWPTDLAFIYRRWTVDPAAATQWLPAALAVAALVAAYLLRGRLGRGPLAVALLFGGVLFPAMGFFNVYAMRYSYVADHFAYQAVAVFAAGVAGGLAMLLAGRGPAVRRAALGAAAVVLAALGTLSFNEARQYRDADTLWQATLARSPDCFMCEANYGFSLYSRGRVAEAIEHFERSLRIKPDNVPALLNLARVEEDRGRFAEAIARLEAARAVDPADTTVLVNLGTDLTKAGRYDDAVAAYRDALLRPSTDEYLAHNGLGVALIRLGRGDDAVREFREALRLKPDYWAARANLEQALARLSLPN